MNRRSLTGADIKNGAVGDADLGLNSVNGATAGLPRGIYFASYSILTSENVTLPVRCAFTDDNERGYSQSAMPLGSFRTNNASTVLDFTDEVGMAPGLKLDQALARKTAGALRKVEDQLG